MKKQDSRVADTIAAIIPTYRRWSYMCSTVEQLLEQTRVPDEIIIVDQTPEAEVSDEDRARLKSLMDAAPRVKYYFQPEPYVYRARNRAAALAKSDLLLYLDDDIMVDRRVVEYHLDIMTDPAVDAAIGYTTNESNRHTSKSTSPRPVPQGSHTPKVRTTGSERIEHIDLCIANHFCIRRAVLFETGGWDEHILTYGDREMGFRLANAGKNIVYDPRPRIVHLVAPAGGSRLSDPTARWPSWQRAVSIHYLTLKYFRGKGVLFFLRGLMRAARHTLLLRRNAIRPWCWPIEIYGYIKGFFIARRWVREGTLSSLASTPDLE